MIHSKDDKIRIDGVYANERKYTLDRDRLKIEGNLTEGLAVLFMRNLNQSLQNQFEIESTCLLKQSGYLQELKVISETDYVVKYWCEFIIE